MVSHKPGKIFLNKAVQSAPICLINPYFIWGKRLATSVLLGKENAVKNVMDEYIQYVIDLLN